MSHEASSVPTAAFARLIQHFASRPAVRPAVEPEDCTIIGTEGNDVLEGTDQDDVICGLGGDDEVSQLPQRSHESNHSVQVPSWANEQSLLTTPGPLGTQLRT